MKNIISIIVILTSLAAFVFVVKPQYEQIKELQAKNEELEKVLVNAKRLQNLRDDLLDKRKSLSGTDLARLEKLIPESADNVKLIIEFQNIARKYNLSLETAAANKDEEETGTDQRTQSFDIETKDYGIVALDFSLAGSYSDFVSFLSDIGDNLRITDIRSLTITPGDENYSFTIG
ncbi:MAG: hypothetical protein ACPGTS_00750 [Minisyncoccia bacterium]